MRLVHFYDAAAGDVLAARTAMVKQRVVFPGVVAEQRDAAGKVAQVFIADARSLRIGNDHANADRQTLAAQPQELIVLLEIQFLQRCQVVDQQNDLRQIRPARFAIGREGADADGH